MSDDVVIVAVVALTLSLLATIGALVLLVMGRASRRWRIALEREEKKGEAEP